MSRMKHHFRYAMGKSTARDGDERRQHDEVKRRVECRASLMERFFQTG